MNQKLKNVLLYTDGACSGNPGPGGFAYILIYKDNIVKVNEGYKLTTNNRMELLAVIRGLQRLKVKCNVDLYTDSKYVSDSINKGWLSKWITNNWVTSSKKKVKNIDLWKQFNTLYNKHNIKLHWVKGHSENQFNNECDILAVSAYNQPNLLTDNGYITQ